MTEDKPVFELDWSEIAASIFAAKGITDGLWRLSLKMRFAAVNMRVPKSDDDLENILSLPSGIASVEAIAIFKVKKPGAMVFDAAQPPIPQEKYADKPIVKVKSVASKAIRSTKRSPSPKK